MKESTDKYIMRILKYGGGSLRIGDLRNAFEAGYRTGCLHTKKEKDE